MSDVSKKRGDYRNKLDNLYTAKELLDSKRYPSDHYDDQQMNAERWPTNKELLDAFVLCGGNIALVVRYFTELGFFSSYRSFQKRLKRMLKEQNNG